MSLHRETNKENENHKLFFEGRLTDCRHSNIKHRCMRNPESAGTLELLRRSLSTSSLRSGRTGSGHGRQVSFIIRNKKTWQYTDLMKPRVDSVEGKLIYSHRMSVVEPVFGNIGLTKSSIDLV